MSDPSSSSILDRAIKSEFYSDIPIVKTLWLTYWPYIIGFFVFVIAGVVIQILMLRSGHRNKLSAGFNSLVGSLTYSLFFLIQLLICYLIFGAQVIDDIWFTTFGAISFPATWAFLNAIGFWYY